MDTAFLSRITQAYGGDLSEVAGWIKANHPRDVADTLSHADEYVRGRFRFEERWDLEQTHVPVDLGDPVDWLKQPGNDPEFVYALNRMNFWKTLGKAWLFTQDERYSEAFVRQASDWIRNVPHTNENAKAWRTLETGVRLETWTRALGMMEGSKAVTDDFLTLLSDSLKEQCRYLMTVWDDYQRLSNWGIMANHGLFLAGVLLETQSWQTEAIRRLTEEVDMQVYDDGSHWEQSAMYHNEMLHQLLSVLFTARRLHIPLADRTISKVHQMARVSASWQLPDGTEPTLGDSDVIDQRDLMELAAVYFEDPLLKAKGERIPSSDAAWELGMDGIKAYGRLSIAHPSRKLTLLEDSGNAYWEDKGTLLHFKAGTLGAGHGHADQLSFDLYAQGRQVLLDPGRYTYVPGRDRYAFKESAAHNTVKIDGLDCYECKDSWEYSRMSCPTGFRGKEKEGHAYLEAGQLGWQKLGVFVRRKLIVIDSRLFVVCDELYSGGEHTLENFLHFHPDGKLTRKDDHSFLWQGPGGNLWGQVVGADTMIETSGFYSPHYNQKVPIQVLRTSLHGTGFQCLYTVLSLDGPVAIHKQAVHSVFKGITFPDVSIESFTINGWTLMVSHKEWGSPTDSAEAGGHVGWGQCILFEETQKNIGCVLAW